MCRRQLTFKTDDVFDHQRQIPDGNLLAGTDIDQGRGSGVVQQFTVALLVQVHQEQAGFGQVVHLQELAQGRAGAPDGHSGCSALLCLVEFSDQGRQDMGFFQIEVVVGAVEVVGHGGQVSGAVLAVIGPAHGDAGDLGDGVGVVGRLQRAGQQILFLDRLRRQLGVDAGAAQEEQPL